MHGNYNEQECSSERKREKERKRERERGMIPSAGEARKDYDEATETREGKG